MSTALDLGAFRFRSLWMQANGLVGRTSRAVYSILPTSELQQRLLRQAEIPYVVCQDDLLLMGDAAVDMSTLFHVQPRQLLPSGELPPSDPLARQMIATLVEQLLPFPKTDNEICCLCTPECASSCGPVEDRELDFFTRLVRLRGYSPLMLGSAMATLLAHMKRSAFTGVAFTFGASRCDFALGHLGVKVAGGSVKRGGDWIDTQFAEAFQRYTWNDEGQCFLDTDGAREYREGQSDTLLAAPTPENQLLVDLQRELIKHVVDQAAEEFSRATLASKLPQPINIVCNGGISHAPGFGELLSQCLYAAGLPFEIGQIRIVAEDAYDIARGCLICAEVECGQDAEQILVA